MVGGTATRQTSLPREGTQGSHPSVYFLPGRSIFPFSYFIRRSIAHSSFYCVSGDNSTLRNMEERNRRIVVGVIEALLCIIFPVSCPNLSSWLPEPSYQNSAAGHRDPHELLRMRHLRRAGPSSGAQHPLQLYLLDPGHGSRGVVLLLAQSNFTRGGAEGSGPHGEQHHPNHHLSPTTSLHHQRAAACLLRAPWTWCACSQLPASG